MITNYFKLNKEVIMDTQKQALEKIQNRLPRLRNLVYEEIQRQQSTIYELSKKLNLSINIVSPRVRELVQMGKVICCGTKKNEDTGLMNKVWSINKFGITVDKYDINRLPRRDLINKIKELENRIKELENELAEKNCLLF